MGIASIRHFSRRPISAHIHLVTSQSRRLTRSPAARADSLEPRGALSWSERTWSHSVPTERTSPSARSTGASLPRGQLTEKLNLARRSDDQQGYLPTPPELAVIRTVRRRSWHSLLSTTQAMP